jgi:hypothetical protein
MAMAGSKAKIGSYQRKYRRKASKMKARNIIISEAA